MHELSLMQALLETAIARARDGGAQRIERVTLRVGALAGAVPEALAFAFEAATPGTLAAGAQLAIEWIPATYHCQRCDRPFESADVLDCLCPICGLPSGTIARGRELQLVSLEVT